MIIEVSLSEGGVYFRIDDNDGFVPTSDIESFANYVKDQIIEFATVVEK